MRLSLTTWSSLYLPKGFYKEVTWDQLCKLLAKPKVVENKKDAGGFSCGKFIDNYRSNSSVIHLNALIIEYDVAKLPISQILEFWSKVGYEYYMYSTFSHTNRMPRVRLIFPLSRAVSSSEYAALWCHYNALALASGHLLDQTAKDASRFWFCPAIRHPNASYETHRHSGNWLPVDDILSQCKPSKPLEVEIVRSAEQVQTTENLLQTVANYAIGWDPAVSGSYGRRTTFKVALKALTLGLTESQTLDVLMSHWNPRCVPNWKADELVKIIHSANSKRRR